MIWSALQISVVLSSSSCYFCFTKQQRQCAGMFLDQIIMSVTLLRSCGGIDRGAELCILFPQSTGEWPCPPLPAPTLLNDVCFHRFIGNWSEPSNHQYDSQGEHNANNRQKTHGFLLVSFQTFVLVINTFNVRLAIFHSPTSPHNSTVFSLRPLSSVHQKTTDTYRCKSAGASCLVTSRTKENVGRIQADVDDLPVFYISFFQ